MLVNRPDLRERLGRVLVADVVVPLGQAQIRVDAVAGVAAPVELDDARQVARERQHQILKNSSPMTMWLSSL
jgi:hypothetical protein